MRLRLLAVALLGSGLLSGGSAVAQTTWARSYGGNLVDRVNAVDVVPGGGYVVAGSFGSGFGDLWVLRLDAQGAVVWQKTYGGSQPDEAFAVKSTSDGGFVVAGVTHSFGAGNGDAWVLKLDAQGNVVAQKAFGGSSLDQARSLVVVADGYVVAGTTNSFGAGGGDAWVFKLDGQLDVVWSRTFGDANTGAGTSIIAAADGGLLFSAAGVGSPASYAALMKLDGAGTPAWSKSLGATFGTPAVTLAGGGSVLLVPLSPGLMVTKFDDSGNVVWSWAHTGHGDLSVIAVLADGGFVATGGTRLLRLDSNGGRLWSRAYGANGVPGNEILRSVAPTPDGGYVLAGQTGNFGAGGVDAWVIKVNSNGLIEAGCPHAFTSTGFSQIGNTAASTPPWANAAAAATAANTSTSTATPSMLQLAQCQSLIPASLTVDATTSGASNLNQVFEPGETCVVEPGWSNQNGFAVAGLTGTIGSFTGPAGAVYSVDDNAANYGTVASGATTDCSGTTGDCYGLRVSNPSPRPAPHWDADFIENLSSGERKVWSLHIGRSFSDVTTSNPFYRFIETLLHRSVTGGCTGTQYCPATATTREQMAPFVLVAKEGSGYVPPACTTPAFADVPASSPFCRWIEELARRGVVGGCGGGNYCPTANVTREQMAVFVLRTLDPALDPPACTTPMFADVPASSPYCRWIEELARRGVVTGCGGGNYCPTAPVTREQMSVFLSVTFGLTLYGP